MVVAATFALCGCGGDDDEPASQPRPDRPAAPKVHRPGDALPKREFLGRADAICSTPMKRAARIADAAQAKIANEDAIGVAAELRKALPIVDDLLARLRALPPPKGDDAAVRGYLETVARQRRRLPGLIEAVEAEDISQIEVIGPELRRENQRAGRLAEDYGFKSCGAWDV